MISLGYPGDSLINALHICSIPQPRIKITELFCCQLKETRDPESELVAHNRNLLDGASLIERTVRTSKRLATLCHLVFLWLMATTRGICGVTEELALCRCWDTGTDARLSGLDGDFVCFQKGCQTPTCREEAILTRKGPVVLETSSSLYTRATLLTNNTAEMSAMIEIWWFLLTIHAPHPNCVNTRRNVAIRTEDKVIIHPDSKYAMGIALGLFLPRENVLMAKLLRHLYGVVQKVFDISLRWTRGHDGDIGNLLADSLAHDGCAAELPRERDFMPLHWDAEEFANMLAENDMNQTIPVHETMGAHVKRIKQLARYKRREIEEQSTTQPVRAPQPRPSCTF